MRNKKRLLWAVCVLVVGFIIADYCEMFPCLYKDGGISLPFEFTFIDSVDGSGVEDVKVSGLYKGQDAIIKRFDFGDGIVHIVARGGDFGYKETFLFKKPSPRKTIKRINGKEIEFTFQHPNYKVSRKTISKARDDDEITIKLVPIENDSENN